MIPGIFLGCFLLFIIAFIGGITLEYSITHSFLKSFIVGTIVGVFCVFACTKISDIETGTAEYNGTIYSTSTDGLIWTTNHVAIKTDLESTSAITFAVQDHELFEQFKRYRSDGVPVVIKCRTLMGANPWVGDSFIATSVTPR